MQDKLKKIAVVGVSVATFLVLLAYLSGPSSVEIRIDCGDLRFKYFGIPLQYMQLHDPDRTTLISIAHASSKIAPIWVPVVPKTTSYDSAGAYRLWYSEVVKWAAVDKDLCRVLLEDLGDTIKLAGGKKHVAPEWLTILKDVDLKDKSIPPAWTKNALFVDYCKRHGYMHPGWVDSQVIKSVR